MGLTSRRSDSRRGVAASALVVASALLLTGCVGGQRREPTEVVSEYLTAIGAGDATSATALAGAAVDAEHSDSTTAEEGDFETLRTDAVLLGAESRIEDVEVQPGAAKVGGDEDLRRVTFSYVLDGEPHESSLQVRWDDEASEWTLEQSLTLALSIAAVQSKVVLEPAPFRIAGIDDIFAPDAADAPLLYLVYPGEYTIEAAFPSELLRPGAEGTQTIVADIPGDALVQFDVSELPSR